MKVEKFDLRSFLNDGSVDGNSYLFEFSYDKEKRKRDQNEEKVDVETKARERVKETKAIL